MKLIYTLTLVLALSSSLYARQSTITPDTNVSSGIRRLFDYLLHASRLNIQQQDNITVGQLITDANNAGYNIDTVGCNVLSNNLNKLFYTLTPQYVSMQGLISAPFDSAYLAMVGSCKLSFSAVNAPFEHRLSSFYSKNLTSKDTIQYTVSKPVSNYSRYIINHFANADSMDWYVSYLDIAGIKQTAWFKAKDSIAQLFATAVNMVQDVDTFSGIYSAALYTITEQSDPGYIVNQSTYLRPTTALLRISPDCNRPSSTGSLSVNTGLNPSKNYFNLVIRSASTDPVLIRLSDINGRPVEISSASTNYSVAIGKDAPAGMYYVEVIQGKERVVKKLMKL